MSVITFVVGNESVSLPAKFFHTIVSIHNVLPSFSFLVSIGTANNSVKYFITSDMGDLGDESGGESGSESQEDAPHPDDGSVSGDEGGVVVLEVGENKQEFDYDEFWDAVGNKKVIERVKSKWNKFELIDLDSKICISHCKKKISMGGSEDVRRSVWLEVLDSEDSPMILIDLKSQPLSNFEFNKFGVLFDTLLIDVIKLFVDQDEVKPPRNRNR